MSKPYAEETRVKWKWGDGYAYGKIQSHFEHSITRKIEGEEVTRDGSKDNPAYYILTEKEDSGNVVKLHSEIEKA